MADILSWPQCIKSITHPCNNLPSPNGPIFMRSYHPGFGRIMTWCRTSDKPLPIVTEINDVTWRHWATLPRFDSFMLILLFQSRFLQAPLMKLTGPYWSACVYLCAYFLSKLEWFWPNSANLFWDRVRLCSRIHNSFSFHFCALISGEQHH